MILPNYIQHFEYLQGRKVDKGRFFITGYS